MCDCLLTEHEGGVRAAAVNVEIYIVSGTELWPLILEKIKMLVMLQVVQLRRRKRRILCELFVSAESINQMSRRSAWATSPRPPKSGGTKSFCFGPS